MAFFLPPVAPARQIIQAHAEVIGQGNKYFQPRQTLICFDSLVMTHNDPHCLRHLRLCLFAFIAQFP